MRNLNDVYNRKLFRLRDIVVYLSIAIVIAILFVVFVILPKKQEPQGFAVYVDGEKILECYYDSEKIIPYSSEKAFAKINEDNTIYIYFGTDEKQYNLISYDKTNKNVKVKDANCSNKKDCVKEVAISNSGAIYCAPHKLKITPIGSSEKTTPTTG